MKKKFSIRVEIDTDKTLGSRALIYEDHNHTVLITDDKGLDLLSTITHELGHVLAFEMGASATKEHFDKVHGKNWLARLIKKIFNTKIHEVINDTRLKMEEEAWDIAEQMIKFNATKEKALYSYRLAYQFEKFMSTFFDNMDDFISRNATQQKSLPPLQPLPHEETNSALPSYPVP